MYRFGIIIFIFFCFALVGLAQGQYSLTLTKMEKSVFGVDYSTQNDESRLKRLEEEIYGKISSGNISSRVNKLSKDISADVMDKEIKPSRDTFENETENYKEPPIKADKNVNYPVVDKFENEIFKKQFKGMEIEERLSNLEKNVFGKTYNDDLNSRVERLKVSISPGKNANNEEAGFNNDYIYYGADDNILNHKNPPTLGEYSTQSGNYTGGAIPSYMQNYNMNNSVLDEYQENNDLQIPLASLEKQILKKSYPDDSVNNRLIRLEAKLFNTNFSEDDINSRLDRIAGAHQAKKSSKRYDSNKFAQHASTAMQVGAILLMILAAIL